MRAASKDADERRRGSGWKARDSERVATYVFVIYFFFPFWQFGKQSMLIWVGFFFVLSFREEIVFVTCYLSLRTLPSALIPNSPIQCTYILIFIARFLFLAAVGLPTDRLTRCTWKKSKNVFKSLPTSVTQAPKWTKDELPCRHAYVHTTVPGTNESALFQSKTIYKYNRISNLRANAKPNRRRLSSAVLATNRSSRKISFYGVFVRMSADTWWGWGWRIWKA